MDELNKIVTNPAFTITGFVVGILGLALGVYAYFKQGITRSLSYAVTTTQLAENVLTAFPNMQIMYAGIPVQTLADTTLVFWNSGTEIIKGRDIAGTDPLRIVVPEGVEIMDAHIAVMNGKPVELVLDRDKRSVTLSFEFLAAREGAVIEIMHTGEFVALIGDIKGVGQPRIELPRFAHEPQVRSGLLAITVLSAMLGILLLVGSAVDPRQRGLYLSGFVGLFASQVLIRIHLTWETRQFRRIPYELVDLYYRKKK